MKQMNKMILKTIHRTRKKSILRENYSISGIQDILNCTFEPRRYKTLQLKSKIYFKKTFLRYLKYCIQKELVINNKVYGEKIHRPIQSWFIISEKGRKFLEMIE